MYLAAAIVFQGYHEVNGPASCLESGLDHELCIRGLSEAT